MTWGSVARAIDAGGYADHVRDRLAPAARPRVEGDRRLDAALRRVVNRGEDDYRTRVALGELSDTPETGPRALQGDRTAGGDCSVPRGGESPVRGGGGRVLTGQETADMLAAVRDPDYVRRLIEDARVVRLVEVDNPFRVERRPRRV